jgi:hypothetical protein
MARVEWRDLKNEISDLVAWQQTKIAISSPELAASTQKHGGFAGAVPQR